MLKQPRQVSTFTIPMVEDRTFSERDYILIHIGWVAISISDLLFAPVNISICDTYFSFGLRLSNHQLTWKCLWKCPL